MLSFAHYNAMLPDFLPGHLVLERGNARDYRTLADFHYAAGAPATWAGVFLIRYVERVCRCVGVPGCGCVAASSTGAPTPPLRYTHPPTSPAPSRTVAVGVLSYPVPSCRPRERYFGRAGRSRSDNLRFANANLRTISRIIVHPQFRALGLSTVLVRCLCEHCDTRYVEAIARMGRVHPLFERAGMIRTNRDHRDEPAYHILERHRGVESVPRRQAA